jgi:hypothetical protein
MVNVSGSVPTTGFGEATFVTVRSVLTGVDVAVGVMDGVDVGDRVAVAVADGVLGLGVGVDVRVGVLLGVFVIVGVALAVTVGVLGSGVFVAVAVGVAVGASTSVLIVAPLFVSSCSATTLSGSTVAVLLTTRSPGVTT